MKIWLDAPDPKSVIFLNKIAEKFNQIGAKILFTTRMHREIPRLLQLWNIKANIVGSHGKTLKEKLIVSAERILNLIPLVEKFSPDCAISFSSPECARVAFGLAIPHITLSDSPHAEAVSRLTVPLSRYLFSPWVIPKKAWTKYGIQKSNIYQYKGLDVVAWIKNFKPNEKVLDELGLDTNKKLVVIRALEVYAAYVMDYKKDPTVRIVRGILHNAFENIQIVVLPRYESQIIEFKKEFANLPVKVAEEPVDAQSLIYYADLHICSGGTMAQEGALLGTPTISSFPIRYKIYYLEYLAKKKLLFKPKDINEVITLAKRILKKSDLIKRRLKERAKKELRKMEDPAEFTAKKVTELLFRSS